MDYGKACKVGLQFSRRFWEEDEQIFGGISWTNQDISQIWYPSHDYLGRKGVLLGCYNFGIQAEAMAQLTPQERLHQTLVEGRKLHPQYDQTYENGFSVAWDNLPYSRGCWSSFTEETRRRHYPHLIEPDDRIYLAGEHTTYLIGWMAGALESARRVVQHLHRRVQAGSVKERQKHT